MSNSIKVLVINQNILQNQIKKAYLKLSLIFDSTLIFNKNI